MSLRPALPLLLLLTAVPDGLAQARRMDAANPGFSLEATERTVSPGAAFLYSALLPGAGQGRLGSSRWVPYALLEMWGWMRYVGEVQEGRDFERRYRDLAWSVARQNGVTPRRDGDWEYYEALSKFAESGSFDADPDRPGIQPETDEATFNGSIWALARAIHFPADADSLPDDAPEYRAAVAYYGARAVTREFGWSWVGKETQQMAYSGLIRSSDEAFRDATRALGLILANHLVSAVDALVTARLGGAETSPPVELQSTVELRGDRPLWTAVVRIPWPGR